jgi:hydroxymethylbilane synthase
LLSGVIDLAVHSAKDVPLEEDPALAIAAYPERADPRDVLVTRRGGGSLEALPRGASVGTDSPRRAGFLLAARPDLEVIPLHGNVETRLRRLDEGAADALVLAAAGMDRLGRHGRIDERFEPDVLAPAPGQGALAVQVRQGDARLMELVSAIDDRDVRLAVEAEREVLRTTGGTCRAPVGALASISGDEFVLLAGGVNSDGSDKLVERLKGSRRDAGDLAARLGRRLLAEVALR